MAQQDDIRGGRARQRAIRMAIGALVWISLAILYNTANGVFSNRNVWLPEGVAPTQVLISAMIIYIRGMSTVRGVEIINDFCNRHFDNKPFKQTLE